ncbi:MAG: hypothetical protein ACREHF_12705 [Rhizomicrobium sp.]
MKTAAEKKETTALASGAPGGAFALATACVAVASFFQALHLAARLVQTSDSVQGFVAGHAVASGNLLLAGWRFPLDDYYFTDTIPYAALESVLGARPWLLALEPALVYALFVVAALCVCLRRSQTLAGKLESLAVLALLLASPVWIGIWNPLFLSDMHVATAVGALVVLVQAARLPGLGTRVARMSCASGVVLLTAAIVFSDPFAIVFAFAPALVVLGADAMSSRKIIGSVAALSVGAALGWLLLQFIAVAGGFVTESDVVGRFVTAPLFGRNLEALLGGLLRILGIGFDGNPVTAGAVVALVLRCAAFAIVIVAVARTLCRMSGPRRAPRLERLLCAGILAVLAACAASEQFGKGVVAEHLWEGGPPMRYLVPAYLFGTVLAARAFPETLAGWPVRAGTMARGMLVLFATVEVVAGSWRSAVAARLPWIDNNAPTAVARWLEQRGLSQGTGEYWSANLVTALSANRVQVRSVVPDESRLVPYIWVEDSRWYTHPPQFVLWQEPNKTGVTEARARATYSVCAVRLVASYRIGILALPGRRCQKGRSRKRAG